MSDSNLIILVFLIIVIVVIKGVVRVPEYQRIVIYRLWHRLEKTFGPGLVFTIPIVDQVVTLDLREISNEFTLPVLLKDGVFVSISFRWHFVIADLPKFVRSMDRGMSDTDVFDTMQAVSFIGEFNSTELTEKIEFIQRMLRLRSAEVTKVIGVQITKVEILNLVIDDQLEKMYEGKILVGTYGETQSDVHTAGTVLVDEKSWNAVSDKPIPSNTKVRIKQIILVVEQSIDAK